MKPNLLSWEETLFRDQDVFDLNYVPEQFDYRDVVQIKDVLVAEEGFFPGKQVGFHLFHAVFTEDFVIEEHGYVTLEFGDRRSAFGAGKFCRRG